MGASPPTAFVRILFQRTEAMTKKLKQNHKNDQNENNLLTKIELCDIIGWIVYRYGKHSQTSIYQSLGFSI